MTDRSEKMLALYLAGGTLESVAAAQDPKITRERVRQLLSLHKEYHFERARRVGDKIEWRCAREECGVTRWVMKHSLERKYCSPKCAAMARFGTGDRTERHLAMTHKICSRCKEDKQISEFYQRREKGVFVYWSGHCKQCHGKITSAWRERNMERSLELMRAYQKKNKEKLAKRARERYWANPEESRRKSREAWHKYKKHDPVRPSPV